MRKEIKITVFTVFILVISIKAQTIGQATVKTWANDSKSAFSLTFDDSFESQYTNARPVLNRYNIKATFYLIAGSIVDSGQTPIWRYGTWNEFKKMADEGHEMGAHTMTHPDLTKLPVGDNNTPNTIDYEMYKSKQLIEQKIGQPVITLAYPYTTYNPTVITEANKYFEASRAGNDTYNNANITGNAWQRLNSIEEQFDLPRNSFSDDVDELNNVKNYVQSLITNDKWGILFGHEVLPYSQIPAASQDTKDYWYPMASEWLDSLCYYLKGEINNNNVWVSTVANVTKYIKERENFSSDIVSVTDSRIELNFTDNLDDNIFNYPLTVDVLVPSTWQNVVVKQGSNSSTVSTFMSGGNNYIRANVVPDGGTVVLTDDNATDIAGIENNTPNKFVLNQNYPNPFNPSTTISYALPSESKVKIEIINLLGQEVATLVNTTESAGHHEVKFNAGNLASGVYIYRIFAVSLNNKKEFVSTKKLMLLK